MQINVLIIQENKAENLFLLLDELFWAFQMNFHHRNFLMTYKFSLLKIAWRVNEWRMFY